ncbi:MAG: cyanophycinase [Leptolyngbya foveolarum]|uniref:Cyanophycinase n=1 Tax=Leptolyngbya foveolarum TaxID=47253 RepID=A0A2W4U0Q7_9CYAN|nr:MAG: cyanophycinase [Leptolyngbya foveolarum]
MLELKPFLAQKSMAVATRYPIIIIGGAEDKTGECTILKAFFESAGGNGAKIGIIPSASREPTLVGTRYYEIFTNMGAQQVQVLDIRYRSECDEPRWLDILRECTGVFITGGDQLRLHELTGKTPLMRAIKAGIKDKNLVVAGTSAGAAIMGENMIAGGSSGESPNQALVDLTEGLGIVPELLVDQHFHNRNRMARLLSAIAAHPDRLGVGIDEDTSIALTGKGSFEVIGKGSITIVDPGDMTHTSYDAAGETAPISLHNLKVHILKHGDHYDYKRRRVLSPQLVS